jgi:hypothetical protein
MLIAVRIDAPVQAYAKGEVGGKLRGYRTFNEVTQKATGDQRGVFCLSGARTDEAVGEKVHARAR